MPEITDQPPDQHSPVLPEPSYAAQVLMAAAAELERVGPGRRATETALRRAITVAVAARLHHLPDAVVRQAATRAWDAIPAGVEGNTNGVQARILRGAARGLR